MTGSKIAGSIPKKGTVAEPGLVSIAPGNGVTTIDPVSVCLFDKTRIKTKLYPQGRTSDVPEGIYDCALFSANVLVIPVPCLRVDGFADAAEHPQTTQIVALNVVRSKTAQKTNSSGRRVELGELIFVDGLPIARRSGINRGRFEDSRGHPVGEGSVNNVARL